MFFITQKSARKKGEFLDGVIANWLTPKSQKGWQSFTKFEKKKIWPADFTHLKTILYAGKEFEVLIDSHGPEHVTQLMQKVISSLEQLEKLATLGDAERETIENLNTTISHLELEDTKKIEERQRNSKVDS